MQLWICIVLFFCSPCHPVGGESTAPTTTCMVQRGRDFPARGIGDVALSEDGRVLAMGHKKGLVDEDGRSSGVGLVRVYRHDPATDDWAMMDEISADEAHSNFGSGIDLTPDGRRMVVSAPAHKFGDDPRGRVRVYDAGIASASNDALKFVRRGSDMDGNSRRDIFGSSVAISSDGKLVFASAPGHSRMDYSSNGFGDALTRVGEIRMFTYSSTLSDYVEYGYNLFGLAEGDRAGSIVDLSLTSPDGYYGYLALREPGFGNDAGRVKVFKLSDSEGFVQVGQSLVGRTQDSLYGWGLTISSDGKVLAAGETDHVDVWQLRGNTWQRRGQRIKFEGATAMSMSGDGSTLAVAAPLYDSSEANNVGRLQMYKYDEDMEEWKEYGSAKTGVPGNGFVGWTTLVLSRDGKSIVFSQGGGSIGDDTNFLRVFAESTNCTSDFGGFEGDEDAAATSDATLLVHTLWSMLSLLVCILLVF